jgi:short-subunit dehydrogenase
MKKSVTAVDKNKFGPWAIVTGASSGIGQEFARQLAASELNLVLIARRLPLLEALGRQLSAEFGVQYRAVEVDLSDEGFLGKVEEATRDLDVGLLISNAGAVTFGEFLARERSTLYQGMRLNVMSHLSLAQHYGQKLAKRGRGGVLLVSSTAGAHGAPFMADYTAAKAYLLILGEALHIEFQQLGLNMTVLLPGPTDTPGVTAAGFDADSMPMKLMSVQQCVAEGLTALNGNRATHIVGRMNRLMAALIPRSVMRKLMGTMLAKALAKRGPQAVQAGY